LRRLGGHPPQAREQPYPPALPARGTGLCGQQGLRHRQPCPGRRLQRPAGHRPGRRRARPRSPQLSRAGASPRASVKAVPTRTILPMPVTRVRDPH
jgi:hypothetical protein